MGLNPFWTHKCGFKPLLGLEPMATFRSYVCMYVCMYVYLYMYICIHLCMFAIVAITKVNIKCTIRAESRRSHTLPQTI